MNDFDAMLNDLEPDAEAYVLEMAKNPNDTITNVLQRIGVSKAKFYTAYPAADRQSLDDLARAINRDTNFRALRKADENSVAAMNKLVQLMHGAKSEYVQLQAAQEILNRALGASTQRFEGQLNVSHDWRAELRENGIDDATIFNQLVATIANQSAGD